MTSARKISQGPIPRRKFNRWLSLATAGFGLLRTLPVGTQPRIPLALVKNADRKGALRSVFELLGEINVEAKDVYLKGNFTSGDSFPATTHPTTLRTVVQLLRDRKCARITLLERSSMGTAAEIWDLLGIKSLAKELDVALLPLESLPSAEWRKEALQGSHWKKGIEVPGFLDVRSCVVQICNLKTHRFGGQFSASLKNSLGLISKYSHSSPPYNYMEELHESPDQRLMIAEVNQVYSPALVIMDAMQVFVKGGPEKGELASPGVIAASCDRVAIDAVGVALLRIHGAGPPMNRNGVFQLEQLKRAVELKLGATSGDEIQFLSPDKESRFVVAQIKAILSDAGDDKEKKPLQHR